MEATMTQRIQSWWRQHRTGIEAGFFGLLPLTTLLLLFSLVYLSLGLMSESTTHKWVDPPMLTMICTAYLTAAITVMVRTRSGPWTVLGAGLLATMVADGLLYFYVLATTQEWTRWYDVTLTPGISGTGVVAIGTESPITSIVRALLVVGGPMVLLGFANDWIDDWQARRMRLARIGMHRPGPEVPLPDVLAYIAAGGTRSLVVADTSGTIRATTPGITEFLGGDLTGRDLTAIMPERYRSRHLEGFARYLTTGETQILGRVIPMMALHRDGHEVPVMLSVVTAEIEGAPWFIGMLWPDEPISGTLRAGRDR
jgi:PAS domain S-box-containing protein